MTLSRSAVVAAGSPWTHHVADGGRWKPPSQRRSSCWSAWALSASVATTLARTGTSSPKMRTVAAPLRSRRPRVPAAW